MEKGGRKSLRQPRSRNKQASVILSGAKDRRSFQWFNALRTTAEILRSAQDDNTIGCSAPCWGHGGEAAALILDVESVAVASFKVRMELEHLLRSPAEFFH
jgi:hypothetical protein